MVASKHMDRPDFATKMMHACAALTLFLECSVVIGCYQLVLIWLSLGAINLCVFGCHWVLSIRADRVVIGCYQLVLVWLSLGAINSCLFGWDWVVSTLLWLSLGAINSCLFGCHWVLLTCPCLVVIGC
jgi:hypothetical protein